MSRLPPIPFPLRHSVSVPILVVALLAVSAGISPIASAPAGAEPVLARARVDAVGDDFSAKDGARTLCHRLDQPDFGGHACWNVFRLERGQDPTSDYFVWGFRAVVAAKGDHRLHRVKLRLAAPEAKNVIAWQPTADREVAERGAVAIELPFQGVTRFTNTFEAAPGRYHPYVASRLYHVSWIDQSHQGVACCEDIEVAGATIWSTPEGTEVMKADLTVEVAVR